MIGQAWREALSEVCLQHPNGMTATWELTHGHPPVLTVRLDGIACTVSGQPIPRFVVSCVELGYFPGKRLAQVWLACAFAGYVQHEALELVTAANERVLDPHQPPYHWDRGLRQGFPVRLTPDSLRATLEAVMSPDAAETLIREHS